MKVRLLLVFVLIYFGLCNSSIGQEKLDDDWKILLNVKYKNSFDNKTEKIIYQPVFTKRIKKLEGQLVSLTGYVSVDSDRDRHVISWISIVGDVRNNMVMPEDLVCFKKKGLSLHQGDRIQVRGILQLNSETSGFIYALKDAKVKILKKASNGKQT